MSRWRSESPRHHLVASLIILVAAVVLCIPATALADLTDDIVSAFDEFVNGLTGDEIESLVVEGDLACLVPPTFLRHWEATVVGVAFCSPPEPFADPVLIPVPPHNIYGCTDAATFDIVPDGTTADVVMSIDPLYVDLEFEREEGLCWTPLFPPEGQGPEPPHYSDGYILMDVTLSLTLELVEEGGCFRAGIAPGSVDVALGDHERELTVDSDDDACFAGYVNTFGDALFALLLPQMETALELLIEGMMPDISDMLCDLTPVSSSTWGGVKAIYRTAPEGERR